MPVVDLRSDTVTKPTAAMMEALARAPLGDDGRGDDPTVTALEAMAADRMGKAAGLFVPSGTMGNQIAILAHSGRAGEVLAEATSHIFRSEMGGVALVAGLFHRGLPGTRGAMDSDALADVLKAPALAPHHLGTALVCMETTHNAAGGAVLPLAHMAKVKRMAGEKGVPVHVDGARIFNAAIALGVEAKAIATHADSVTFCISKGLSAPVGSVLTGSAEFITRARGYRRLLGGNLRQAGLLAACGIVALEQLVDRLQEDHDNARALARGLETVDPRLCAEKDVETNIVMVNVPGLRAEQWVERLAAHDVLALPASRGVIRLVTHREISRADVDRAVAAFVAVHAMQADAINVA
jgi:threonine aldolase